MRIAAALAGLAVVIAIAAPAAAEEAAPAVTYGATVGVSEYVGTPWVKHYGVYPNVGAFVSVPTSFGSVTPAFAFEYSPEFGVGGLMPSLAADVAQSDVWGVDVIASAWSDQATSDFSKAAYYAGLGAGASVFLGKVTLSGSANFHRGLNAAAATWIAFPSLGASYTF